MKRLLIIIIVLIHLLSINAAEHPEKSSLKFMLQWFPQAQFAGYIAAVEEGYFQDQGLEIELLFNDGSQSPLKELASGEIDMCSAWLSQAMKERSEGSDIVHILQVLQKSSLLLISLADSGIETTEEMNGKCISMWGKDFSLLPNAFMEANKIKAEIIPQAYTVNALLEGECDLSLAMYYNEYFQLIQSGYNTDKLNTFMFSDYGLNFPEDGIYTSEELYKSNPETIAKFNNAVLKGWSFTVENPQKALEYVMKYIEDHNVQTTLNQQKWMLNAIIASLTADGTIPLEEWGKLSKTDYQMVGSELMRQKMITVMPEFDQFVKGKY